MISLIFLTAVTLTLHLDIIQSNGIEELSCELVPVNNALVEYGIELSSLFATVDCTKIFKDGFE